MKIGLHRAFQSRLKKRRKYSVVLGVLSILWLLIVCCLAFLWHLGSTGLVDETEPLFAEAARQLIVRGDWITPYFNETTRFDKPILIYWLMAISYKILGVNSWAVRLPSALSAIGLACLSFYTMWLFSVSAQPQSPPISNGQQMRQRWLYAVLGSTLIAFNLEIIVWARIGVSDLLLTGCIGGALLSFFLGYAQPTQPQRQVRWYLTCYVLIALGILTKGPVGIVLPGLTIATFLLYLGNWREVLREMRLLRGTLIIIFIALPWYALVTWRNGWAFIDAFFGYHNVERFTSVVNRHSAPWYFYFLVVLIGFLPWAIYLPVAIARLKFWQRSHWRSAHRSKHFGLFALFWFAVIFAFFTVAVTKLPNYVLPLMPGAAILVALMWGDQISQTQEIRNESKNQNSFLLWSCWLNVAFLLLLAGVIIYIPNLIDYDPAIENPRQLLEQSGLTFIGALIWGITAVAIAVSLFWRCLWSGVLGANLLGFLAFLIFVLMPANLLVDQARQLPLRQLSEIAIQAQQPGERLMMVGFRKPSVVFYTQRPVRYILRPRSAVKEIKEMAALQSQPPTLLILSQPNKFEEMGLQPNEYQNLGQKGTYQLIRVSQSEFQQNP